MRYLITILILLSSAPAVAQEITGAPRVIDGDTIDVAGQRIRLHGIDAPESRQSCRRGGVPWLCGAEASKALRGLVRGESFRCDPRDVDRYDRIVVVCHAGGRDLNEAMVARGWALAYRRYSTDYVGVEAIAQAAGAGLWSGAFVPPWDWRKGKRLV